MSILRHHRHAIPRWAATACFLIAAVLMGLYFRSLKLDNWDNLQGLHPDERFIRDTVVHLRVPRSFGDYLTSVCPKPIPNPRPPDAPDTPPEPSIDSGCSTLNPRNFNWSHRFVYGTLPTTLVRVGAELTATQPGNPTVDEVLVTGRRMAAAFDLLTLIVVFLIGRRLYSRDVGAFAAGLYACAVLPIQQSHFFTTDNFGVTFVTLALLFGIRMAQTAHWRDALLTGASIGAAVACKINLAAVGIVPLVAAGLVAFGASDRYTAGEQRPQTADHPAGETPRRRRGTHFLRAAALLALVGLATFAAFRVAEPDAFIGPSLWNIKPEPRFIAAILDIRDYVDGTVDWPPAHQWAARAPYLFAWQNMVVWGMGLPLGLAAWLAWAAAFWLIVRRRAWQHLILWTWVAVYWAWQGAGFSPFMRYFLPIYPPLIVFAAWGLEALRRRLTQRIPGSDARPTRRMLLRAASAALPLLLICTFGWAWAFTRIYTRPHPRVAANNWVRDNLPQGTKITSEEWDDSLPGDSNVKVLPTRPFEDDEPTKFLGKTVDGEFQPGLIAQLAEADYVALSSARVYDSVVRLPHRFPATIRYYQALFDGSLGFDLVEDFASFPTLFGLPIDDSAAEEAFTVYDHPRVLIFKRTPRFNPEQAERIIVADQVWAEVYRTSAKTTNSAPTMLRLTERTWSSLTTANTGYVARGLTGLAAVIVWLVAIELLGLAMFGLLWHFRLPFTGGGLGLARVLGLIVFALPLALLATRLSINRPVLGLWYGLLVASGLRLAWFDWHAIVEWLAAHRRHLLAAQAVYLVVLLLGLAARLFHPTPLTLGEQVRSAQWLALLRSPMLPPYDPLFAGGHLTTPYAALLPLAGLARLTGIDADVALNLALPTLFALLALTVWTILVRTTPRGGTRTDVARSAGEGRAAEAGGLELDRRRELPGPAGAAAKPRPWPYWVALLGTALALAPGLPAGTGRYSSALSALLIGDAATLAALLLLAVGLALGFEAIRAFERRQMRAGSASLALWTSALTLLGGHSGMFLGTVVIIIAITGLRRIAGWRMYWTCLVAALALVAAALGRAWSWSIAPGVQIQDIEPTPGRLLLAVGLALALSAAHCIRGAGRFAGWPHVSLVAAALISSTVALWFASNRPIVVITSVFVVPSLLLALALIRAWFGRRSFDRNLIGALLQTIAAVALLALTYRIARAKEGGDPALLVGGAGLLLALVGARYLALFARSRGRLKRERAAILTGLAAAAIGLTLGNSPGLRNDPARWSLEAAADDVARVIDGIADSTQGLPLVAAVGGPDRLPTSVLRAGLPTLLAADETERRLRNHLEGAVERVMAARGQALEAIYGADPNTVSEALRKYHIDYVILSDAERARFGNAAGQGLAQLADEQALKQVFAAGDTVVFEAPPVEGTPPFVATRPKLEVPSIGGMLARPLRELPVVSDFAWNTPANTIQPLAVVLWLLMIELIGLLVWPITRHIFGSWHAAGWAWSKVLGWLIWGYIVWLIASLHLLMYNWLAIVVGAILAGLLACIGAGWRWDWSRRSLGAMYSEGFTRHRREILRNELLFVGAYLAWVLVRAANPDLWHPTLGGEKPFEFGFLNAILRSPYMPPADPFFSGGAINYYYYGLFLVSLPIKATGIAPAIAFNLAIATIFALVVAGSAAIVRELTGRWRYGLLGVLFVAIVGPLSSALQKDRGLSFLLGNLRLGLRGFGTRVGDWFWGPSRTIPFTINEFPFFSYLFADLHPHMIALPFTLVVIALALEVVRRGGAQTYARGRRHLALPLALGSLALGTLAAGNSWDAPTYALVLGGALVGATWRAARREQWQWNTTAIAVARALGQSVLAPAIGLLLFAPFFLQYEPMVGGLGRVHITDTIAQFLILYGAWIFAGLSFLAYVAVGVLRQGGLARRRMLERGSVAVSLLIGALLLSSAVFQEGSSATGWGLRVTLALFVLAGVVLAFVARLRDEEWTILWLMTVAFLAALAIQFVYIRDHLDGNLEYQRMNTVFKFGFQIWTLLALSAAAAVPIVTGRLRRANPPGFKLWLGGLSLLIACGLVYPLAALPSRLSVRFAKHPGLTLDGLAFLNGAEYDHGEGDERRHIVLTSDRAGIDWLNSNVRGLQVVFHSDREFYRAYGMRIAANTGLPTILGNLHENEQRPGALVAARAEDATTLLNTPDQTVAVDLLQKFAVDYVYIGPAERAFSQPAGLAKWDRMVGQTLDVAFERDLVKIYRVRDGLPSRRTLAEQRAGAPAAAPADPAEPAAPPAAPDAPAEPAPPPPAGADDTQLESLEEQNVADPANGPLAFDLGGRYLDADRPEDALRVLRAAAAANPNDVGLHHRLGDVQARLGRTEEALQSWRHAAQVQPSGGTLDKLGLELTKLGQWREAEQALLEARKVEPDFTAAIYSLAELYRARNAAGDRERAIDAYQEYLREAPADAGQREAAERRLRELGQQ